jgi:hypothetical protein
MLTTKQADIGGETFISLHSQSGSRRAALAYKLASAHGFTIVTFPDYLILCHRTEGKCFWPYQIPHDTVDSLPKTSLDNLTKDLMTNEVSRQMMTQKPKIRRAWKSVERYGCLGSLSEAASEFGYSTFSSALSLYFVREDIASEMIITKHEASQSTQPPRTFGGGTADLWRPMAS